MTSIFINQSKKLFRGSLVLVAVFGFLSVYLFAVFPSLKEATEALEGALPEAMMALFGMENLHTIEGFTASYVYAFFWVLFIGIYFAYIGGGLVAGDIKSRKMDLTLANPVSRESVVLQKFGALWVPLLVLNVGFFAIVLLGSFLIGESLELIPLLMTHLLSVPYFLVCAGIGLVFSVIMRDNSSAQAGAVGLVFVLWLIDGAADMASGFDWLAYLNPGYFYDVNEILIYENYSFLDAGLLVIVFLVLLAVSIVWFIQRDI
ncbi:ABC transporter permease subunit [Methanonatronarchaeum sp. AMET-Sl]|uniref:ABC transporter permease subunit n=1 Tax=Methanonatronarchaeum sp. AMET-Sl TaxID=3037654 RepID=UPI00244DE054|nr:ABC transporter permease subunit [Methanonatronarchaeum sp. AMET-Sl]WGI17359.1 ABC transporter permease subunit [Methanonatronarchaeum sp. AMET-Sl]